MAFICGSLSRQEEDDYDLLCPLTSTSPRKPTRRRNIFGIRNSKTTPNPYADRGLDKFEALLADLDHKRQKILTQKGAEDVTMVKFIYRTPDEVKPIVVKLRDHRKHNNTSSSESSQEFERLKDVASVEGNNGENEAEGEKMKRIMVDECKNKIRFGQWRRTIVQWWKPSYYVALFLILILILVLLMFSGRSFAILCTTLGWYLVPIINERLHSSKHPKKIMKKDRVLEKVKMN